MNEFDKKAAGWDANPLHTERTIAVAGKMMERIALKKDMEVLEFGAGTGQLSLLIKDHVGSVTMVDNSREMIRMIRQKLEEQGIENLRAIVLDLEKEELPGHFDLIYSQMVFHHVSDIKGILERLYALLKPGGYLAIADLYTEDGTFHDEPFTGHFGFDPELLAKDLLELQFTGIHHEQCFVIRKSRESATTRDYPVFLLTARKGSPGING